MTQAAPVWRGDLSSPQWDEAVAALGGHPLQSAVWGDARRAVDGIEDVRLAAFVGGEPVLVARVEMRAVLGWWRIGWVPRGPAAADHPALLDATAELHARCREAGCSLLVIDPYQPHTARVGELGRHLGLRPRTIVVDLTRGEKVLWAGLERYWRRNVRSAGRAGVRIEQSTRASDVSQFCRLCRSTSDMKGFRFSGSEALISQLLTAETTRHVRFLLFVARWQGQFAAGGVVAMCGRRMHQIWSAVDRELSDKKPSEALQWGEIEWALSEGLERYDLEGIDPKRNPGTYDFKRRMGGVEVDLPGKFSMPLTPAGRLLSLGLPFVL